MADSTRRADARQEHRHSLIPGQKRPNPIFARQAEDAYDVSDQVDGADIRGTCIVWTECVPESKVAWARRLDPAGPSTARPDLPSRWQRRGQIAGRQIGR
jgi:hypothetical protein